MISWVADVAAVAVGVWLAGALLVASTAAAVSVWRRRRMPRTGDTVADLLRRRGVI